jgi:uncharacterized protein YhhL (DUF1145 family)
MWVPVEAGCINTRALLCQIVPPVNEKSGRTLKIVKPNTILLHTINLALFNEVLYLKRSVLTCLNIFII